MRFAKALRVSLAEDPSVAGLPVALLEPMFPKKR